MSFLNPIKKREEVMACRVTDFQFVDLPVEHKTDVGLVCKKIMGVIHRFWRGGPGWTGEKLVRYLAIEGRWMVCWLDAAEQEVTGTLEQALRFVWGPEAYEKLTKPLRDAIEDRIGIVVTVKEIPLDPETEEKLRRIKADAILDDADIANLDEFGKGSKKKPITIQSISSDLLKIGFGILLGVMLKDQGIFFK